jgi:FkbM family methyltransferase
LLPVSHRADPNKEVVSDELHELAEADLIELRSIGRRLLPMNGLMSAADYFRASRVPPYRTGSTKLFDKPILFSNTKGFFHSVEEIFQREVYRFQAQSERPYIIDAGANIGLSIIYFKRLYPNCSIVAYEPDHEIFSLLIKNIAAHQYENVDVREAAAWVSDGHLEFFSEGSLAGSTEVDFLKSGNIKTVRSRRLKSDLQDKTIDFLKIDIEGAENEVLFDIEPELSSVQNLFFEYHSIRGKKQMLGDLLALVTRSGFRYVINETHGPRLPFVERSNNAFDIQMNVSCFRT